MYRQLVFFSQIMKFYLLLRPEGLFTVCFSEEAVTKEKIWSLVAQNEPSLIPLSMVLFVYFH